MTQLKRLKRGAPRALALALASAFAATALAFTAHGSEEKRARRATAADVDALCTGSKASPGKIRETIAKEVVVDEAARAALVSAMKIDGNRCRAAIAEILAEMRAHPEKKDLQEGRQTFVLLGVAARMPEAVKVIESEIDAGGGNEWLDALAQLDPRAYERTLKQFVHTTAQEIRKAQDLAPAGGPSYGAARIDAPEKGREEVRIVSPLIVDRYLRGLSSGRGAAEPSDLAALNALFAGANATYRQVFLEPLKKVIQRNEAAWLLGFRSEPAWVQFRLFPLMSAAGGPEMVRELMWISQNHGDARVRSLAVRTLDEVVAKPK